MSSLTSLRITALAGGVGAARFLRGVVRVVPETSLSVIVNTGDDEEFFGLSVSPDLDTVTYTLANAVDSEKAGAYPRKLIAALRRSGAIMPIPGLAWVIPTLQPTCFGPKRWARGRLSAR